MIIFTFCLMCKVFAFLSHKTYSNVSGAYDFDFDDEISPVVPAKLSSKMSTPKGTNKKRTTMAGIVANMEKHKLMDKMDDATSSKSANH